MQVVDKLGVRAHETDRYIVDRLRDALQILKRTDGEQQRLELEYRIVLTAIAPHKVGEQQNGMGREYGDRLKVAGSHLLTLLSILPCDSALVGFESIAACSLLE